mgnify:CR=1 FL=1
MNTSCHVSICQSQVSFLCCRCHCYSRSFNHFLIISRSNCTKALSFVQIYFSGRLPTFLVIVRNKQKKSSNSIGCMEHIWQSERLTTFFRRWCLVSLMRAWFQNIVEGLSSFCEVFLMMTLAITPLHFQKLVTDLIIVAK